MALRKYCRKCGEYKFLDDFHISRKLKDGHVSICKECSKNIRNSRTPEQIEKTRQYHRLYSRIVKDKKKYNASSRDRRLRRLYRLCKDDYDSMLKAQNGRCAICYRAPTESKKLSVDHCHLTGDPRGLLCRKCNSAIGMLGDDAARVANASYYLLNNIKRDVGGCTLDEFARFVKSHLEFIRRPDTYKDPNP